MLKIILPLPQPNNLCIYSLLIQFINNVKFYFIILKADDIGSYISANNIVSYWHLWKCRFNSPDGDT